MESSFNPEEFVNHVANELLRNFDAAGQATTPVLVGGAREHEARRKLQMLLPQTVAVGSGCVIDSYGCTSKQADIVLYEKDICPVFSINDNPETTYYPCEGVIAVGEVKSRLDTGSLKDSFSKIASVKKLKRHSKMSMQLVDMAHSPRGYGSIIAHGINPKDQFDQKQNGNDQILGFVLAGNLAIAEDTLLDRSISSVSELEPQLAPNIFCILDYGMLLYIDKNQPTNRLCLSRSGTATGMQSTGKREGNFQYLLKFLRKFIQTGRTTEVVAFERYFSGSTGTSLMLNGPYRDFSEFNKKQ